MARKKLEPNPENGSPQELKETSRIGSAETALRCTAIQLLITGITREQVCASLLVSDRSMRKWIKAFNERGIDGLIVKKRSGRNKKIKSEEVEELTNLIEKPEHADRTFWTAKAFHGYLSETYRKDCSYSTVVRFFHENGFALKVPRPCSDRRDEVLRETFRKELKTLSEEPDTDIWFLDESGFEGESRSRRRWDKKGKKTKVIRNGDHIRMSVIGMVCPRTGEFFALEVSHVDTEVFQVFLNEVKKGINPKRKRNVIIMDNASWHKRFSLDFHGYEPKYLPPYSPDLNPIERIWLLMKERWFNNIHCKTHDQLIDHLTKALLDVINNPEKVKKTTSIGTLF